MGKYLIVCSELIIKELRKDYDEETINQIFSILLKTNKLENIDINKNDIITARDISKERKVSCQILFMQCYQEKVVQY